MESWNPPTETTGSSVKYLIVQIAIHDFPAPGMNHESKHLAKDAMTLKCT